MLATIFIQDISGNLILDCIIIIIKGCSNRFKRVFLDLMVSIILETTDANSIYTLKSNISHNMFVQ